ncbi:MAG: hypothetical protein ABII01_06205 [Candidatus Woesearchaeota archaeon]
MREDKEENVFRKFPQRKLTDAEKQFIALKIEKSKLNRERAILILDKGLLLFLAFLLLGIIGFLNKLIPQNTLNFLVIAGLCVLLLSVIPYSNIARKSEKEINDILESLMK